VADGTDAARTRCAADTLWVVTAYFNPAHYRSRADNYAVFRAAIERSGLPLLTIECAFDATDFTLPRSSDVIHVRSPDVLWQKERLLNLAIDRLPAACRYVAWVDGDTLFENPDWAAETVQMLDRYPVVQAFEGAVRLPRGCDTPARDAPAWRGFAAAQAVDTASLVAGDYRRHGETGLAWAARREVLAEVGLFDACVVGGGDHVIAHALCGDWASPCIGRLVGVDTPQLVHLQRWGRRAHARVRAALGFVRGAVWHLWHGEPADRHYTARHTALMAFGFDPATDIRIGDSGCWEWASAKPDMHRWVADYFAARQEDGPADPTRAPSVFAQRTPAG